MRWPTARQSPMKVRSGACSTMGAKAPKRMNKVADAGYECHLNSSGGYLLDAFSGERVPMQRKGSLYTMRAWVKEDKQPVFSRPE